MAALGALQSFSATIAASQDTTRRAHRQPSTRPNAVAPSTAATSQPITTQSPTDCRVSIGAMTAVAPATNAVPCRRVNHAVTVASAVPVNARVSVCNPRAFIFTSFWLGMMLISIVSVNHKLLPSFGAVTPAATFEGWERITDIARHAILPVLTLSVLSVPGVYVTMRYTMLSVLGEDFIRTARAKGLSERVVLFRHVLRNSLAPVVTILAIRLGFAFGGTVVIETVFSYPGLGRLIFEAVSGRDYPVLQAADILIFTQFLE